MSFEMNVMQGMRRAQNISSERVTVKGSLPLRPGKQEGGQGLWGCKFMKLLGELDTRVGDDCVGIYENRWRMVPTSIKGGRSRP
jgi:hypothetical protein